MALPVPGVFQVFPALAGSGAYSSGQCVGPAQKIGIGGPGRASGKLQTLTVIDKDNQKAALAILFFADDPVGQGGATVTDQAAFAWGTGTAPKLYLGKVDIATGDYESQGSTAIAVVTKAALGMMMQAAFRAGVDPAVYAVVTTTGTPTYTTAGSLIFNYGFDQP
jgi:hypothetical protein